MEKENIINTVIQEETTEDQKTDVETQPKKKRVIIGLPGNEFSSMFLLSWTNALSQLWTSNKYDIIIAPGTGSCVHFVRMQTLGLDVMRGIDQKPFNNTEFDVWVTIDSDIIFNADQLIELIESTEKHPVVSGMYRMADLENFAIVKDWNINYFKEKGCFEYVKQDFITKWKEETKLKFMPVHYTGLGFFACRKEVLDKMSYPYFNGELTEIRVSDTLKVRDMSSEDVNFCKNILKEGYEIMVNTDIRVGHMKPLII